MKCVNWWRYTGITQPFSYDIDLFELNMFWTKLVVNAELRAGVTSFSKREHKSQVGKGAAI